MSQQPAVAASDDSDLKGPVQTHTDTQRDLDLQTVSTAFHSTLRRRTCKTNKLGSEVVAIASNVPRASLLSGQIIECGIIGNSLKVSVKRCSYSVLPRLTLICLCLCLPLLLSRLLLLLLGLRWHLSSVWLLRTDCSERRAHRCQFTHLTPTRLTMVPTRASSGVRRHYAEE